MAWLSSAGCSQRKAGCAYVLLAKACDKPRAGGICAPSLAAASKELSVLVNMWAWQSVSMLLHLSSVALGFLAIQNANLAMGGSLFIAAFYGPWTGPFYCS